jgi:hypothetical protein
MRRRDRAGARSRHARSAAIASTGSDHQIGAVAVAESLGRCTNTPADLIHELEEAPCGERDDDADGRDREQCDERLARNRGTDLLG